MYRCMLCENIETSVVVMVEHIFNYHRLGEPNVLVDVADLYQREEFDGFVDTDSIARIVMWYLLMVQPRDENVFL